MVEQKIFDNMLEQLNEQKSSPQNLTFSSNLSDEQLNQLIQYINTNPSKLRFSHISLHVDKAILPNKHFHALLDALNKTALQKLDLVFPVDELQTSVGEIATLMNQSVVGRINYPVIICEQSVPIQPYQNKELRPFYAKLITHIQHYNQVRYLGTPDPQLIDEQAIEQHRVVAAKTFDKKIKMKALIKPAATGLDHLDQYIKLEIQHTEVEQQEEVQAEIIDVAAQEQEQEQGFFDGQLVDFNLFNNEPYRSRVGSDMLFNAFKYELFGNMPKAIKFLSHEAAMKIAENAGAFVALNADNLPESFILKRTPQGELVLDYDPDADEQITNVFTPKEITDYAASALIYDNVDLPASIPKIAALYGIAPSSKQLDNLWVRYGDMGVQLLFDTLGRPGELSTLIIQQYLNRFPHWDRLLDDGQFLHSLEKIKQYESAALTCLTEFLSHMDDTTQFNLEDILKGFDAFWLEWSALAKKNKLDLNEINGRWSHRKVGNPLVYMERLLTILKNSRDLLEQLACLDGLNLVLRKVPQNYGLPDFEPSFSKDKPSISLIQKGAEFYLYGNKADGTGWGFTLLNAGTVTAEKLPFPELKKRDSWPPGNFHESQSDPYEHPFNFKHTMLYRYIANAGAHTTSRYSLDNYGAYYASKYEGFHIVSKEMGLHYDPDRQNAMIFNPDSMVYRVELDRLVEYCAAKAESRYYSLMLTKEEALAIKDNLFLIPANFNFDLLFQSESKITKEEIFKKVAERHGEIIPYHGQSIESPYKLYRYVESKDGVEFSLQYLREPHPRDEVLRENLTNEQIIERAHRFLGQQPKGIPLVVYKKGLKEFLREFTSDTSVVNSILTSLFFVGHERYTGHVEVYSLLRAIERMECHHEVVIENNRGLMKLFQQDIRLNDQEGYDICQRVGMLNSAETDDLDKAQYIQKLFLHLQNNKQDMLKAIQHFAKHPASKWPFVYALDTAEYLMKNPSIKGHYHTDLLLFSTLINPPHDAIYLKGRDSKAIELVTHFLQKAAIETHPNNLDYAIKAIVQSSQYFCYPVFLKVCEQIVSLNTFDSGAVETVLTQYGFQLRAVVPDVLSRDTTAGKVVIIDLLLALEMAEGNTINLVPIVDASELELHKVNDKIVQFEHLSIKRTLLSDATNETQPQSIQKDISALEKKLSGASLTALQDQKMQLHRQREKYQCMMEKLAELRQLRMKDLQVRLNQAWQSKGIMLSFAAKLVLYPVLVALKNSVIHEPFSALGNSAFMTQLRAKIYDLDSFKDADNFEKIDRIANEAATLAGCFNQIINRNYFKSNEEALTQIFSTIDYAGYDYQTLFALLYLLVGMPERDYAEVLSTYIHISNKCSILDKIDLINDIRTLHSHNFPSVYIAKFVLLFPRLNTQGLRLTFLQQLMTTFQHDEADPLLLWMMKTDGLTADSLSTISTLTQNIINNRAAVHLLFAMMSAGRQPILDTWLTGVTSWSENVAKKIIEILAITYTATPLALLKKNPVDYIHLTAMLGKLSAENLDTLYTKLRNSSIAITCLNDGLNNLRESQPFNDFINDFEKAPFGKRDLTAQFDIEQVERVVNGFIDLNNQSAYSYTYRKQMMEAFLLVNRAGNDLPVYYNKPAKDLSNDEIKQLFCSIKSGEFRHLDPFQTRLYALGLMREAMYRTTGQFPYSTQMITLIDCMMHQGDVISNIDTGQGKSMIDAMKATLLWLESGRVDLTTASLIDAKRDINIYCPFWSLLGVPFAKTPISSTSPFDTYERQGINLGTIAQFALFYSKAKGEQVDLDSEQVSLVMNESDYTILDDRIVYRYASTGGPGLIGAGKEWIYDAINQFVIKPDFKADTTSQAEDVAALRAHLLQQAKRQKKSAKIIEKLSDKKLLMLLESAIIVNYRLKENVDYVLTEKPEPKLINGVVRQTRSAKILMKDGKVSTDSQYGNGMQQLLYSKLNKIYGDEAFIIEPESKTIISSNNRNMIDYYRSKKGFIWGSSGTVGWGKEIDLQYQKYGFEFSKVEPHQSTKITLNKPIILSSEIAQFKKIIRQLQPGKTSKQYKKPNVVFFKDIETATRFHAYLKDQYKTQAMQLYTGLGHEEQIIRDAAQSGMITITTPALGRNTDIDYDKSVGMDVIITFVASARVDRQMGGRTGRQGSKGHVIHMLNQADLGKKTIDEVRAQLDEKAEIERQFNEELYDTLGGLLRHLGKADKAFFKEHWSEFSEQVESRYRTEKQDGTYRRDQFLQDIVAKFNALTSKQVLVDELKQTMHQHHEINEKDALDKKNVVLADCISPDIMAYHFVNPTMQDNVAVYLKDDVKAKLTTLFAAVNTPSYVTLNNDYIAYLNRSGASKAVIKEAHQAFLSDYLNAQVSQSKNTPFYKRWLGFEGHLNKVVGDSNYLLLFKAMVDVRLDDTMDVDINASIVTLLEEYTQYSWFVSASKRDAANTLIEQIKTAKTIDQIVDLLSMGIIDVMKKDCDLNRNSFWRNIKPANALGDSRLQNTLNNALRLASIMKSKSIETALIQEITKARDTSDPANAKVATKSLESMSKHNRLNEPSGGMKVGRIPFGK